MFLVFMKLKTQSNPPLCPDWPWHAVLCLTWQTPWWFRQSAPLPRLLERTGPSWASDSLSSYLTKERKHTEIVTYRVWVRLIILFWLIIISVNELYVVDFYYHNLLSIFIIIKKPFYLTYCRVFKIFLIPHRMQCNTCFIVNIWKVYMEDFSNDKG